MSVVERYWGRDVGCMGSVGSMILEGRGGGGVSGTEKI